MIRCLIVDDEPWAVALLSDYAAKVPFLELVLSTTSAIEAIQKIMDGGVDLVFLDIQMPEITGLQLMKIVSGKCKVVLTTAYGAYALDGYEHNVTDYLLKPISFERFYRACIKVQEAGVVTGTTTPAQQAASHSYIFVKTDSRIIKVALNDVVYVEGLKDYIAIHTTKGKILALQNLKKVEEGLYPNNFLRIHKSYIVSLDKIDAIERNRVFIGRDIVLPIGDTYKDCFFAAIKDKHFG
jgi:two-component system LytT family response regulator